MSDFLSLFSLKNAKTINRMTALGASIGYTTDSDSSNLEYIPDFSSHFLNECALQENASGKVVLLASLNNLFRVVHNCSLLTNHENTVPTVAAYGDIPSHFFVQAAIMKNYFNKFLKNDNEQELKPRPEKTLKPYF